MHVSLVVPTRDSFLYENRLIFVIFDKNRSGSISLDNLFLKKTENLEEKNNKLIKLIDKSKKRILEYKTDG
jgi:Ca2+-binding EF-hand superfamily protein